jgi:predicted AlkP superfamily pyrophosphatase or phosphodiesterase
MLPPVVVTRAIVLAVLLLPVALAAFAESPVKPTVILLSLDGVRHDYLDRDREVLPALTRIAREGARAEALVPVFPASTFPNHVSLATGTYADRHGIVANRFFDPAGPDGGPAEFDYSNDASWIEAEPLWVAAERQGVRAASFFWVGSETPWHGVAASHRRAPFDDSVPEAAKVAQILAWLDLPPGQRPRLILSWWHGADGAGHRFGPDADETRRQLAGQDAELARLLAALDARDAWVSTTLVVVSDHGMVALEESLDARALLRGAGIRVRVVAGGSFVHVFLKDPSQREQARAVLDARPGVRAYASDALPPALRYAHPRRVGDVVALTDPPLFFGRARKRLLGGSHGGHGYDPARFPEMQGIFLALGRGVAPGARPGRVRAVDVAPTLAALLGIEPPRQSEGEAVLLSRE